MPATAMPEAPIRPKPSASKYRPEIDGLRAFAVVAVIINHFNKDLLPSGYLGVDIFFVISGYVITSSLAGRESKNFLDFVTGFYERRIKRLVPALVVFVLITSVLICLFNPDPGVALGLGWRSLFGVSNINLYQGSTDYFAESTELNPFTHTWSLGVEEQFYLLFPFLIWFSGFGQQTATGARNLFFWVGALTIASLIGFIYLYQVNQPAAYFLMPPRFWEMAAGCLIFIGFQKRARIEQALEQVPPLLVVAAMVGVMFLPVSAAVPATISIVVLSAVLIACLKQGTAAYKFFTIEKVAYVGLISYSLYLWHWSVLSISRWTIGIHWWSVPIQVGLMVLVATGSYRYIETPVRRQFFKQRFASIPSGLLCLALSAFIVKTGGIGLKTFLYTGNRNEFDMARNGEGHGNTRSGEDQELKHQTMIILGNSHAKNLLPLAKEIAKKNSLAYRIIETPAKPIPSINGKWIRVGTTTQVRPEATNPELTRKAHPEIDPTATQNIDEEAVQAIGELKRGDILVLSSRHYPLYRNLFVHNGVKYYQTLRSDENQPLNKKTLIIAWKAKLRKITEDATRKGANIVFISPLPEFQSEMEPPAVCLKEWFRYTIPENCRLKESRNPMLTQRFLPEMKRTLKELEDEFRNFYTFDPFKTLCPPNQKSCDTSNSAGRLFSDNDHLSVRGALLLSKEFNKFLVSHKLLNGKF